jgi:hypothetical protein
MEDEQCGVFEAQARENTIVYKQFFSPDELEDLLDLISSVEASSNTSTLATGLRSHVDLDLRQYDWICARLQTVLAHDYFPDLCIDPHARLYAQSLGGVREHRDVCHDGHSNHTLLIYLSDDFSDGRLSIKRPRSAEERHTEPEKSQLVFTPSPITGYGVVFHKSLLHRAAEVYEGTKKFLLVHFFSAF